jgi:hypothetical protein
MKTLNSQKHPSQSAKAECLARLENATQAIQSRVGWYRKREVSHSIFDALKNVVPEDLAFDVAFAMTGVKPEPWRTAAEAMNDLFNLGVKIYYKKLRRLYRKAIRAGGNLTVAFNASGRWDSPDSKTIKSPLAILRIRVNGDVHFQVSQSPPTIDTGPPMN